MAQHVGGVALSFLGLWQHRDPVAHAGDGRPGYGFVVREAVGQAAMQDADPAVGELVQGGVVALVPGSELLVVGASPG